MRLNFDELKNLSDLPTHLLGAQSLIDRTVDQHARHVEAQVEQELLAILNDRFGEAYRMFAVMGTFSTSAFAGRTLNDIKALLRSKVVERHDDSDNHRRG